MRLATLFSGIGAPEQGATRVYDEVETVFACEWDKFARKSYKAIYDIDDDILYDDVHDLDATPYRGKVDILVGGSPCQSFSIAGLRGGTDDERGKLIYQYIRVVDECRPSVIVYENVKGMLSIDNGRTVKEFAQALRDIGYFVHHEVVNTKDYGVPQNRERLFLVCFLDHEAYYRFEFAPRQKLTRRLKDVLEDDVDERYYLSIDLKAVKSTTRRGVVGKQNAGCLDTQCNQAVIEPSAKVVGMLDIKGNDQIRRVYDTAQLSPCLQTMKGGNREPKIEDDYRIRKLTPLECWRLQDFPDEAFYKAKNAGVSNTQLYKQAGNSMSVNVLEMIFRQIEKAIKGDAVSLFGGAA